MAEQPDSPVAEEAAQAEAARPVSLQSRILLPRQLVVRGNLSQNWREFRQIWDSYEVLTNLRQPEMKENRMATFITCIGYETLQIYNALPFADETEKGDLDRVLDKMQEYCLGETNVIYERFRFNGKTQQNGESFDNFLTNLIELAKTCQFGTMHDALLRDRIVVGVRDDALRKQLLQKRELTLSECISICRASETTALQMKDMSAHNTVHALAMRAQRWPSSNASREPTRSKTSEGEKVCKYCGKCHRRGRQYCKAFGKHCQACHKMNHFTHMCKSKATATTKKKSIAKLHLVEGDMSSSDTDSPEYGNDRLVSLR